MKKIAIILVVLFLFLMLSVMFSSELKLDNPQKISELYYANEALFNETAETIMAYSWVKRIKVTTDVEEFRRFLEDSTPPVGRDYKIINEMYIMVSEKLSDADYKNIYNAFAPLLIALKNSGFQSEAATYYTQIDFMVEGPVYGKAAELYYFQDPTRGASYTQYDWALQINEHWVAVSQYY